MRSLSCAIMLWSALQSLTVQSAHEIPKADFNTAMQNSMYYDRNFAAGEKGWQQIQRSFDTHIINNQEYQDNPRIPKIIHQIWVGPHPFPEHCKAFQQTWIKYHPGWIYILWTNELVEQFGLKNKAQYDATVNYGEKADIARYEILNKFGGLYIDTDFECLRSFDVLHHCCDFYTGVSSEKVLEVYNGLIGTVPNHPIIASCIEEIGKHSTENLSYDTLDIIKRTGPIFFTQQISKYLPHSTTKTVIFPLSYFYSWPNSARLENKRSDIERWFRAESFAVHHWHMSWIS